MQNGYAYFTTFNDIYLIIEATTTTTTTTNRKTNRNAENEIYLRSLIVATSDVNLEKREEASIDRFEIYRSIESVTNVFLKRKIEREGGWSKLGSAQTLDANNFHQ